MKNNPIKLTLIILETKRPGEFEVISSLAILRKC